MVHFGLRPFFRNRKKDSLHRFTIKVNQNINLYDKWKNKNTYKVTNHLKDNKICQVLKEDMQMAIKKFAKKITQNNSISKQIYSNGIEFPTTQ